MPTSILAPLAQQVFNAFNGKLLNGTLWRYVIGDSGNLTDQGDPIEGTPTTWSMQGFVDDFDAAYRQRAGIPEGDAKVSVFGASLPSGIVPQRDDRINMQDQWWQVRKVATDPAQALWVTQSFACPAPGVSA
jgi:hypothetical protein